MQKSYTPNWSEVFLIKKVKITVMRTYVISNLNSGTFFRMFYENELRKINQTEFRVETVIQRKGNKLYIKWRDYNI